MMSVSVNNGPIEGFAFWADFPIVQDRANFWQADLFRHDKHRSVIFFADLRFIFEK